MKLTYHFSTFIRTACILATIPLISRVCHCQGNESEAAAFDDELQRTDVVLAAQDLSDLSLLPLEAAPRWYSMFTRLPGDFVRGSAITFRSGSVPTAVGLGALTLALIPTDHNTWRSTRMLYRESETVHELSNYAVALGDGRLHLGLAAVFAGYGWLADDSRALRTASQTVEAFIATGLTVQLLKRITGRQSPAAATHNSGCWKFFPHPSQYNKHPTSYYAFPSGHISTAMATLTVIAENYPDQHWIKPAGYTLMGALGVGLVAKGMHWYSDFPVALGLGYLFGKVSSDPGTSGLAHEAKPGETQLSVSPSFDSQGGAGVRLALLF